MSIAQLIRSFSAQPTLPLYLTPIQTYNNPNAYGTSTGDNFGYSVSVETMQLSEPSLRETLEALTQAKPIFLT